MTPTDAFIEALPDQTRIRIMRDYEEWRKAGKIGDCALRGNAQALTEHLEQGHVPAIVLWMEALANGIHRYYALRAVGIA